ncbi:MAG TPA: hypothetical protein VMW22_03445 [Candidatus Desulfaltia sp.]|nr:hypothetical protein [Candidatus Desulfaltia sp.]
MPYRPDVRKGALAVALLLAAVTLVGSSFTIYHFLIHPLVTPKFDGVIVYIDNLNVDASGSCTVRLDGRRIERVEFFGQGGIQMEFRQPEESGTWSVYVFARSHGQLRVRVVDGMTRQLLCEGYQRREGDGGGTPNEVLVALTYVRGNTLLTSRLRVLSDDEWCRQKIAETLPVFNYIVLGEVECTRDVREEVVQPNRGEFVDSMSGRHPEYSRWFIVHQREPDPSGLDPDNHFIVGFITSDLELHHLELDEGIY